MQYSSKDFVSTGADLIPAPAGKLIHKQVLQKGVAQDFSKERGHGVGVVDLPTKTISMTIGQLNPGQSTRKHRHSYETVLFVTKGNGYTKIEDETIYWEAGDALYVPVWHWHRHVNLGDKEAEYVACENTPLLQNLGGLALRQEAPEEEKS